MRPLRTIGVLFFAAVLAGPACFRIARPELTVLPEVPHNVESPVRAFLTNGSVVVFPDGAAITSSAVGGSGQLYDLLRNPVGSLASMTIPLDSVVGLEAFDTDTDVGLSILASVGATVLVIGGTIAIACAVDPKCFGSCPTVYTFDADGEVLEAEAFSYSISPLLEGRDLDRLGVRPDPAGVVELEIRNEALETHYINHLELLEVRHEADRIVLTDPDNVPVVVRPPRPFESVLDRDGREVGAELRDRDELVFSSSADRVRAADAEDDRDWIEAVLPPLRADTAAIVLRLRNSLLNTILFYEFMLAEQGAGSLDWIGRDIGRIGNAVELGSWFHRTMGLRLEVETEGGFREVARLGDTGPIAWKEVAFRVPVVRGAPTRVRLSFLADEWRIDRMGWSPEVEEADGRTLPVAEIRPIGASAEPDLVERVREADDAYLVTSAGTGFVARFDAGLVAEDERRTFLLSSQGYYSEWIRPRWIREGDPTQTFRPGPDLIPAVMARWQEVKGPMERAFHGTRIPVR